MTNDLYNHHIFSIEKSVLKIKGCCSFKTAFISTNYIHEYITSSKLEKVLEKLKQYLGNIRQIRCSKTYKQTSNSKFKTNKL